MNNIYIYIYKILNNKKAIFVLTCSIICTFAAHGFGFVNIMVSHDSVVEFNLVDYFTHKISIGRFMNPILMYIFDGMILKPWLIGIIGTVVLSISIFFIMDSFEVNNRINILIFCFIFLVNISTISLISTYVEDYIANSFAFFFASLSFFIWKNNIENVKLKTLFFCSFLLSLSLGCYQSYISVTILLVIAFTICEIINSNDKSYTLIVKHLLQAFSIIVLSLVLYCIILVIISKITNIKLSTNGYNSLSNVLININLIFKRLLESYFHVFWYLFVPTNNCAIFSKIPNFSFSTLSLYFISLTNLVLFIVTIVVLLVRFNNRKKLFLLVLLLLIVPPIMDITYVLGDVYHSLTQQSYVMYYLIVYVIIQSRISNAKIINIITIMLLACQLFMVQFSNEVYVRKKIQYDATISTMTRVISLIEQNENYEYGKTTVVFIGGIDSLVGTRQTNNVESITGVSFNSSITYEQTYNCFVRNIMNYKMNIAECSVTSNYENNKTVKEMPIFPSNGCIKKIGDYLIVKMGDIE